MPNRHKLGAYIAPTHDVYKRYLFAIDPPWVRLLMPGQSPTKFVSDVYQLCPDAEISLRWWELDDGGEPNKRSYFNDPFQAGTNLVREMVRRVEVMEAEAARNNWPFPRRDQLWFNAPNEPPSWEHGLRDAIATCSVAMLREASKFGFGTLALELAVGHPEEWPPVWAWAERVFDAIDRYDGVLALHEYWQPEGPHHGQDFGALAGRYQKLEADVPIVITECGVDGRIYNRHKPPETGWRKFMDERRYTEQMKAYLKEVAKDARVLAVLPFMTDFADKEWASFDTLPALDHFDKMLEELDVEKQPGSSFTVHLPALHSGGQPVQPPAQPPGGVDGSLYAVVDPYVARAILQVESGGQGKNADGSLKIRFEAHIFERYVSKNIFDAHFRYDKGDILRAFYRQSIQHEFIPYHNAQSLEYAAFAIAKSINSRAAHLSISMGAAQIMGFNHARVGFATPEAMFEAFSQDESYHLIAFFNYLFSDERMSKAILDKDWRAIALYYNGSQLVEVYSARLEQAYRSLTQSR